MCSRNRKMEAAEKITEKFNICSFQSAMDTNKTKNDEHEKYVNKIRFDGSRKDSKKQNAFVNEQNVNFYFDS